ncbi:MAG: ABC transporter substrate-binding protein [Myxococcaceae bacterium]|nr:ABC transporter substrate-binding protein [Myxococcaceae bacterium]
MTPMVRFVVPLFAASLCAGCTLTTATGFEECDTNADCGEGRICVEHYCLPNKTPPGCGTVYGRDEPNAIPFGAALPLTPGGQLDQSEQQGLNAFVMALDEINSNEGVAGRPFVLHVCDTAGDSDKLQSMATWLSDEKHIVTLFTSGSGQTIAASTVTVPRDILVMTATSTSPAITDLQDTHGGKVGLVWRTAPSDAIQGAVLADTLLNDTRGRFTGVNKVGIVYLNDPYGNGLSFVLIDALQQAKTVKPLSYERGGSIDTVISQLNDFDPDLTILVAFPDDAARILNAAATTQHLVKADGHRWFFTDSAKDPALFSSVNQLDEIDGALGSAPASGALANSPAYAQFEGNFISKYGVNPSQYSFTANSYDAIYVTALGAAWAAQDGSGEISGPRIAEGLTHLSSGPQLQLSPGQFISARSQLQNGMDIDIVGTSGNLNFNATTGEAAARIEVWSINVAGQKFDTDEVRDPPGG